ncbi:MAG: UPF0280 family protein [Tepidanaerobacteraceae bacterium]|jgi:ApbE superfamily uncharacterized protein (UPF0280 family)
MIQVLEDGRVVLNHGPIQMLLDITINHSRQPELAFTVSQYIVDQFNQLLPYIDACKSRKKGDTMLTNYPPVLKKMMEAVHISGDISLTPLAAVAGSFADLVLEKAIELGATRVIANNGGDIALFDLDGEPIYVGIPIGAGNSSLTLTIKREDNIRGICTSGLGGRSFTKGIATAAVALARSASIADACATHLGNETNVEDECIVRCYAEQIDSETDIPGHLITLKVGKLSKKKIYTALLNGINAATKLYENEIIKGAVICIGDEVVMVPDGIAKIKK